MISSKKFCKGIIKYCIIAFLWILSPPMFTSAADSGVCGTELTWTLAAGTLTLEGTGAMVEYSDGAFPGWYSQREEIRAIVLPEGLTSISDFAFLDCPNLTGVKIPNTVTSIGDYAFAQCTGLLQVNLGNGIQTIGEGAFQECESLLAISFPASVKEIDHKAFYRCSSIATVTVPDTVEYMGNSVFAYCSGLVRATVNMPVSQLSDWTFYGCESLADVSLSASIVEMGEFSFQNCESLNGIYTQSGSVDTAYELEKSIAQGENGTEEGLVGVFEMPSTSVVTRDDGQTFVETKVTEADQTVVSVRSSTDYSSSQATADVVVSASVKDSSDWNAVAQTMEKNLQDIGNTPVVIKLHLAGTTVMAEDLAQFAGKAVTLELTTGTGVIWKIDMASLSSGSFTDVYDLGVTVEEIQEAPEAIPSDRIFRVKFVDKLDFPAMVGIREGAVYELATLYEKERKEYKLVDTIVVDEAQYAWFALGQIDHETEYYIALNVEGITMEEAVIPSTMYEKFELDPEEEESYLMDKNGVTYRITGRSSKWGITGKQFAMYVALCMLAVVVVVGVTMTSLNIIKRSRERYQRMAEEKEKQEKIDEEALRMEIMRELLGETDRSGKRSEK